MSKLLHIKKEQINTFNLSTGIKNNIALYQRIIEFNYPVRFEDNVDIYFSLKEEKINENCKTITEGKYLNLIKC